MNDAPTAPGPVGPPARATRRLAVWGKRVLVGVAAAGVAGAVGGWLTVRHYEAGLPSVDELKAYNPEQVTRVLARDGTVLGEVFVERRTLVPVETIPSSMKLAVLAAEDAGFYEHAGLNYVGMLRALLKDVMSSRARQGGSTITQQVVKNLLLSPEKTFGRKAREALLARRLEAELGKDEILGLYLNHIYFGHGRYAVYGVEEAARFYFGKGIRDVTLGEAALLAGLIKNPGVYSPRVDRERALARRAVVLDQMVAKGFARPDQADKAKAEPLVLAPEPETLSELAPEVVDEARRELRAIVGPAADHGGYTITTTIDPAIEEAARAAVRRNADDYEKRHHLLAPLARDKKDPAPFEGDPSGHRAFLGVVVGADDDKGTLSVRVGSVTGTVDLADAARYNPNALRPSQLAEIGKVVRVTLLGAAKPGAPPPAHPKLHLDLGPEGALVAIDVRAREILALVGSYEGVRGGLDRATATRRQPGSTFKAFVYGYAIHAREMTPASIVETNPSVLHGYRPDNFDEGEGKTPKRLRDALALSVNVAAVWSLEKLGPTNVVSFARSLGVTSKLGADLSLALGSYEVTPREMAAAYATFAAGGAYEEPILITKIVGPNGAPVELPARPPRREVMTEAEAYVLTSMLTSVVKDGTAKRARSIGRPIAGKTGTSNQAKDGWFVGYSTDIACAVWTGYDDPTPMGAGEAGATVALPAFMDFMREAHKGRPAADFPVPAGVTRVMIDPATGLRAYPDQKDALEEVFVAGTEPKEVASPDAGAPDAAAPAEPLPDTDDLRKPGEAPPPF